MVLLGWLFAVAAAMKNNKLTRFPIQENQASLFLVCFYLFSSFYVREEKKKPTKRTESNRKRALRSFPSV